MGFDFRSLIGGKQFLVRIELARNGNFINSTAHIDGGANIFGAIRTTVAFQLSKLLKVSFLSLPTPIVPTGYNGKPGKPITAAILLTMTIDRRRINFPFLVTDLGSTDVLIGRKFLEHYDLKLDYSKGRNRIHWPKDMPVKPYFDNRLLVQLPRLHSPVQIEHQADVDRRDSLMDQEDRERAQPPKLAGIDSKPSNTSSRKKVPSASKQPTGRLSCFMRDMRRCLQKMEDSLLGSKPCSPYAKSWPETTPDPGSLVESNVNTTSKTNIDSTPLKVDISLISASAMDTFYLSSAKRRAAHKCTNGSTAFVTSVHEINLEMARRAEDARTKDLVELAVIEGDISLE